MLIVHFVRFKEWSCLISLSGFWVTILVTTNIQYGATATCSHWWLLRTRREEWKQPVDSQALEYGPHHWYIYRRELASTSEASGNWAQNWSKVYRPTSIVPREKVWSSLCCSAEECATLWNFYMWCFLGKLYVFAHWISGVMTLLTTYYFSQFHIYVLFV